jgi:hypothetical protein
MELVFPLRAACFNSNRVVRPGNPASGINHRQRQYAVFGSGMMISNRDAGLYRDGNKSPQVHGQYGSQVLSDDFIWMKACAELAAPLRQLRYTDMKC